MHLIWWGEVSASLWHGANNEPSSCHHCKQAHFLFNYLFNVLCICLSINQFNHFIIYLFSYLFSYRENITFIKTCCKNFLSESCTKTNTCKEEFAAHAFHKTASPRFANVYECSS